MRKMITVIVALKHRQSLDCWTLYHSSCWFVTRPSDHHTLHGHSGEQTDSLRGQYWAAVSMPQFNQHFHLPDLTCTSTSEVTIAVYCKHHSTCCLTSITRADVTTTFKTAGLFAPGYPTQLSCTVPPTRQGHVDLCTILGMYRTSISGLHTVDTAVCGRQGTGRGKAEIECTESISSCLPCRRWRNAGPPLVEVNSRQCRWCPQTAQNSHLHAATYRCTQARAHTHTHTHAHAQTHTQTHAQTHTHKHTHKHFWLMHMYKKHASRGFWSLL